MAVPKKRTSSTRQAQRRSHHALTAAPSSICTNCKAASKPHQACANCGFYRGRKVIKV